MSKQASPAMIGGFVVGALILMVVGILVFGSGKFFTETRQSVMYFDGDIKGLRAGASVDFRGVQVGTVAEIRAVLDAQNVQVRVPVIVEIVGDKLQWIGERPAPGVIMQKLVERGLRAQLQLESMVTGQLFVQLDFHPDAPTQTVTIDPLTHLPEIPTVPTTLQQVEVTVRKALETIGNLPLEEIVHSINTTMQGIDRLVNAPEILEAVRTLNATLTETRQFVHELNAHVPALATDTKETLASVSGAMNTVGKLAQHADSQVTQFTGGLQETVNTARVTLESAHDTMQHINDVLSPTSPVGYELVKTLRELSEAARALRVLADYLERNPNSILFGKSEARAQ
jgi:paraquat-inducible protein B